MPRISADSVAEHRAVKEREIMDATFQLLQELGAAPSLAQVAQTVGMSRTAIYHYYGSARELLQAAAREVYPRWIAKVTAAVDGAATPQDAVVAYAKSCIDQVAEGSHAVGTALASLDPDEPLDDQAQNMHASAQEPLVGALKELGVSDPAAIADLVMSVIHAAGQMLESGVEVESIHKHLEVMLGNLSPTDSPQK